MTKKIMFNDKYGLTKAVFEGRKTQTRRILKCPKRFGGKDVSGFRICTNKQGFQFSYLVDEDECEIEGSTNVLSAYQVGEEVAIAQSYETIANEGGNTLADMLLDETTFKPEYCGAGWKNKMFTKPSLMPHRIKITNVRIERLQDISPEDCKAEGVWFNADDKSWYYGEEHSPYKVVSSEPYDWQLMAKKAFSSLINKTCGKDTWDDNPYVFVYEFKFIK